MTDYSPPFGQADLSNCERELIHLAGSVQPHGLLLVLAAADGPVLAASANAAGLLGCTTAQLHAQPLSTRSAALVAALHTAVAACEGPAPVPLQADGLEGCVHRLADGRLVLELEPVPPSAAAWSTVAHGREALLQLVSAGVDRIGQSASIGVLADATARSVRDLIGYDRVMVYKFDADGHGKIIAEARDPRLDSLLGHHYPATDIPQRARALYLLNRVRVLVDVQGSPSPVLTADGQPVGQTLDMSMCCLRSMSPLHLQYLQNMGVTATLVVSLVREGRLWGLVAAHHYAPRNVQQALRSACDLLAEVVSTRIAAIENYAHAQVAVLVRRLEQRLVEATSTEGDWRLALLRNPHTLLQPLEATGAALFSDGEVLTTGEVPSTAELRELQQWVASQAGDALFSCASLAKANPALASLTPLASGVMAVKLSSSQPDYLMWFRKEQLRSVTWAGDPEKVVVGNDPLELSPRRSFAAWSELVRGTALPWTTADLALGRAFGLALVDIIVQVHAVRLLVAEHQLAGIRRTLRHAAEPVLIADADARLLFCNGACHQLLGRAPEELLDMTQLPDLAQLFTQPVIVRQVLANLQRGQATWRGELALAREAAEALPVAVRAESVPGRDGRPLGFVLTLFDLRDNKRAAAARRHLEASLQRAMQLAAGHPGLRAAGDGPASGADPLLTAILSNASLAAMDIADGANATPMAPLLEELEVATQRATELYARIRKQTQPKG